MVAADAGDEGFVFACAWVARWKWVVCVWALFWCPLRSLASDCC